MDSTSDRESHEKGAPVSLEYQHPQTSREASQRASRVVGAWLGFAAVWIVVIAIITLFVAYPMAHLGR